MKVLCHSFCLLSLAGLDAFAQGDLPKGWFLHEDQAPTLTLAYYDPLSGVVDFSVTCTEGYADTVLAFYPPSVGKAEKHSVHLTLSSATSSFVIDATGQMYNDRYVVDAITTMEPTLAELLVGGFTVSVGSAAMGTYSPTEDDGTHVKKIAEACRGGS